MPQKIFVLLLLALSFLGGMFFANPVYALDATSSPSANTTGATLSSKLIPQCLLDAPVKNGKCDNVNVFIWLAINIGAYLFSFIGALALLFFVYGGFLLILSQGNQEKIKQGTGAMTAAVIGLIISFSAYALITFLSKTIQVKAEKSINFVETVYAVEGCMIGGECQVLEKSYADPENQTQNACSNPCTPSSPTAEAIEGYLNIPIGEKAEDVKVLKKGAAALNPMNIGAPTDLFTRAINALFAFIGSIALILYIYAGFIWMSASGNAEKVTKAKSILIWASLGVVAMGASYMIINTILKRVG